MVALESASSTEFSLPWMWHLWWPGRVHQLQGCYCTGYGIYGGPGECISYGVVLVLDMASLGPGECISYRVVHALDMISMVALESASATLLSALESASAIGLSLTSWRVHQL